MAGFDIGSYNQQGSDAYKQGQSAVNSFDPTSKVKNWLGDYNNMLGSQLGTAKNYQNEFANTIAGNPQMQDTYAKANEMYNVPGLAQEANRLTQQVNNQLPQQYQLARGFDVGDAQVQNAANVANRFLAPQATAAQQNANTAQGLASGYVTQQQAQNTQSLLPIQAYGQFLSQNQAAQTTGWTDSLKNELDGLVAKMQSGVQLSEQEMQRAQQLAATAEAYQQAQLQANTQLANTQLQQRYQTLNPAQRLVNTVTGASVKNV